MKKLYPYNELSEKKCIEKGCPRRLRRRLVEQKPTVERCYPHHVRHEAGRNHVMKDLKRYSGT